MLKKVISLEKNERLFVLEINLDKDYYIRKPPD